MPPDPDPAADPTALRLDALSRWAMPGLLSVAALFWHVPSYANWAGACSAVLALWAVWLARQVVAGEPALPSHPVQAAIAPAMLALLWQLAQDSPLRHPELNEWSGMGGAMDVSFLLHLALLGLFVLVAQDACRARTGQPQLPPASALAGCLSLLGSCLIAWAVTPAADMQPMLLGLSAGSGLLASALLLRARQAARNESQHDQRTHARRRGGEYEGYGGYGVNDAWQRSEGGAGRAGAYGGLVVAALALSALLAAGVAARDPRLAASLALAAIGAAACLIALARCRLYLALPLVLLGAGAMGGIFLLWVDDAMLNGMSLWGLGEAAMARVSAADGGLHVLLPVLGLPAGAWLLAYPLCRTGLALRAGPQGLAPLAPTTLWVGGTAAISAAVLLAPGGLFTPLGLLAVGWAWAIVPALAGWNVRRRTGWLALGALAAVSAAMGLASMPGLGQWAVSAWGQNKDFLHVPTGFFVSLCLGWLLGRRSLWLGLAGVLAGLLAGGAGEILQLLLSRRGVEWGDWALHTAGSAGAAFVFTLARLARTNRG